MTRMIEAADGISQERRMSPVPAMVLVEEDGRIVGMNRQAEELFGSGLAELKGKGAVGQLMAEESRGVVEEALRAFARGEWTEVSERAVGVNVRAGNGERKSVLFSVSEMSISAAGGARGGEERTQLGLTFHPAGSAPGQSALLRRLIDAIPDNLFVKDREGRIVINNVAHAQHLGTTPEGCVGKTDRSFFPTELAEKFIAVERRVVEEGLLFQNEEESMDRNGDRRWVLTSKIPLKDEYGRVIGFAGINHEITAVKLAQEALAASEERYRTLYNHTPVMLHSVDAEGVIVHVSDYWLNCLGYVREEVLGEPSWRFYAESSRKKVAEEVIPELRRTGRINDVALELVRKDGRVIVVEVSAIAQYNEEGKMVGGLAVSIDVTQRRKAEAEREELHHQLVEVSRQAGMAEVATGVLHNVGNALNSVNVSTGLLHDKVRGLPVKNLARAVELMKKHEGDLGQFISADPQGTKLPGYLAMVSGAFQKEEAGLLEELESLAKNVEHIKEIVKCQQSLAKQTGVVEEVDVGQLIEQGMRIGISLRERAGMMVACDVERKLHVRTDKHAVLQILTNLFKNAQQAVRENPAGERHLGIRAFRQEDGTVRVEVRDNGVGIEAANLTKIFCHGFTTKQNGHGFGLHSSANTAKRLGGSLEARSEGAGKGAVFVLMLPENAESGGQIQGGAFKSSTVQ